MAPIYPIAHFAVTPPQGFEFEGLVNLYGVAGIDSSFCLKFWSTLSRVLPLF